MCFVMSISSTARAVSCIEQQARIIKLESASPIHLLDKAATRLQQAAGTPGRTAIASLGEAMYFAANIWGGL
jgi:hypothetical protein